jgi:hypothetical protein
MKTKAGNRSKIEKIFFVVMQVISVLLMILLVYLLFGKGNVNY